MTIAEVPMSTGSLFGASTDRGVSSDAAELKTRLLAVITDFYASFYIQDVHREAHRALAEAIAEASVENWDGYGSRLVSKYTQRNAVWFLRSLPSSVPSPQIAVDPDGEVSFEWYGGPDRVFSLSLGEGDLVSFAAIKGRRRIHGTELIVDEIPHSLLQQLGRTLAA